MKKAIKRILVFVIVLCIQFMPFELNFLTNLTKVWAVDEKVKKIESLDDLMKYEFQNNTTNLEKGLEERLNRSGLTDKDIESLDDTALELLKNGKEFSSTSEYYEIVEEVDTIKSQESKTIDKNQFQETEHPKTVSKLNKNEVDDLIKELYNTDDKSDESNDLLSKIGLTTQKVYAASVSSSKVSNSGYLKQTVTLINAKSNGTTKRVYVSYTATWLKAPYWHQIDAFAVTLKNATPEGAIKNNYTSTTSLSYPKANEMSWAGIPVLNTDGVAVSLEMCGRSLGKCSYYNHSHYNHVMTLGFYAKVDDNSKKRVTAVGHYYHQESYVKLSFGIGISSSGISFSGSGSVAEKMIQMAPNPLCSLTIK